MSVREIARQAGVSPSTVSLALRNSPRLAAETRRRVQAVAQTLGYHPNAKVVALMSQLRASRNVGAEACFGVVSLYPTPRPWEQMPHFARIHESMTERAAQLGYRLEPFWLKAPGLRLPRARQILDARGIQGLISFGSPDVDQEFPRELDHYAVVTIGQSIRTRLHRVTSHFFGDTWRALEHLHGLGYRRPGLVLGQYEENRGAGACSSAYFGWCEQRLGLPAALPILRVKAVEEEGLLRWIGAERPDVLVFVHVSPTVEKLRQILRGNRVRVPKDLGVAVISQILEGGTFAGMQQNQRVMGARAVELLASLILSLDIGFPEHPRIEMIESDWIDGPSLK
ncbi:MAG TPA: LacI family DNA-binding transcriptional regulator [Opitutaceae bacterium]